MGRRHQPLWPAIIHRWSQNLPPDQHTGYNITDATREMLATKDNKMSGSRPFESTGDAMPAAEQPMVPQKTLEELESEKKSDNAPSQQ